ncbi:MAG: hypothetical protein JO154_22190 [Chitinophaga sp.]|uniref:hypothetical protein n=1 Tax=Chitinophaga sp. TaxID=1869181 RepID=UPI0025C61B1A|nr:hypothetical protein [Chitinophaga sp.]MBV8255327.1 hypothetical protein [Chitinophaga sp.]
MDEVKNNIKHISFSYLTPAPNDKYYADMEYSYVYDKWGTKIDTAYIDYKLLNGTTGRCYFSMGYNCQ